LYEDSKPVLQDGTYRRQTYLQSVMIKIGGKCPYCGHRLQIPPLKVEVLVPELLVIKRRDEALRSA